MRVRCLLFYELVNLISDSLSPSLLHLHTLSSVTRCWEKKVAQMFPKVGQKVIVFVFYWKSNAFLNSKKRARHLGYFWNNIFHQNFKNGPIWSHWHFLSLLPTHSPSLLMFKGADFLLQKVIHVRDRKKSYEQCDQMLKFQVTQLFQ